MNWAAVFSLDGRAFYIWGSFGAFAIAIILEIILVRMRAKRAQAGIEEQLMTNNAKGRMQ